MTDPTPANPIEAPAAPVLVADSAPVAHVAADPVAAPAAPVADPAAITWPEDWRERKSNGDEKMLKRLQRYASPSAAIDALFEAQTRISKGELLPTMKENATPEDVASYREAHGIPAEPSGYQINLPNGLVIGDADRPMVDEFLTKAHAANMHPSQVNEALGWYMDKAEQTRVAQEARDTESRMATEDTLRAEFGPDYRKNIIIANQLLDSAPEGLKEQLLAGRMADGTLMGNSPTLIKWLTNLSRELNPIGTVVPGSGTNAVQAVESEMAALRAEMGDHKGPYWKGAQAAQKQARYRELVTAMQKRH